MATESRDWNEKEVEFIIIDYLDMIAIKFHTQLPTFELDKNLDEARNKLLSQLLYHQ